MTDLGRGRNVRAMLLRSTALVFYEPVRSVFIEGRWVFTNEIRLLCDLTHHAR